MSTVNALDEEIMELMLCIMVCDFGYTTELPCRYGWHPLRHQNMWDSLKLKLGDRFTTLVKEFEKQLAREKLENNGPTT